jgi:Ca2+-binding RTX toxin-like protein
VSALGSGGVHTAWNDASTSDAYGRMADQFGNPLATPGVIHSTTSGVQTVTSVAGGGGVTQDRTMVVLEDSSSGTLAVRLRIFSEATGAPIANDFLAVTSSPGAFHSGDAIALSNGHFAVVWELDVSASNHDILYRIFDASGTAQGAAVAIASGGGMESDPKVAALSGGGFVVAYTFDGGSGNDVAIKRYTNAGLLLGTMTIASGASEDNVDVVGLADGGFAAVWEAGTGLQWRAFDADGTARGSLQSISPSLPALQFSDPSIAAPSTGGFAIAYTQSVLFGNPTVAMIAADANGAPLLDASSAMLRLTLDNNGAGQSALAGYLGNGHGLELGIIQAIWQDTTTNADGSGTRIAGQQFVLNRTTTGDDTSEVLTGDDLKDVIIGNGGNDTISGGLGNNELSGGLGNDVFIYVSSGYSGISDTIDGGGGTDTLRLTGGFGFGGVITSIEALEMLGAPGSGVSAEFLASSVGPGLSPTLSVTGTIATQEILAFRLTETTTLDLSGFTFSQWSSNDQVQIWGDADNEYIVGSSVADRIVGGAGADLMVGGAGDDTYTIDDLGDYAIEAADGGHDLVLSAVSYIMGVNVEDVQLTGNGNDGVLGNELANNISGTNASNGMAGGLGNDSMFGLDGNDVLDGGPGNDFLAGGLGIDVYFVDSLLDQVFDQDEPGVYDTIWTMVSMSLPTHVEILILDGALAINGIGNAGPSGNVPNLMLGNTAANVLTTYGGDDIVLGRDGNDTINTGAGSAAGVEVNSGGLGADTLTSGGGHDFFVYENIAEGGDTITDFGMAGDDLDILDLRPMFFPTFTNTAGITTVAQAVATGHLTFTQVGANTQVFADANGGSNNKVLLATLQNTTAATVQALTLI